MRTWTLLIVGLVAVLPAVVFALVFTSWDTFVLVSLLTGAILELVAGVLIQGDAAPRDPEENLRQMKANQYGYVAGLEVPTTPTAGEPCSSASRRW